tara:strand:+ start:1362 stop:2036 length:675 start_codon:yes stop_codon:yes gene_type:complete
MTYNCGEDFLFIHIPRTGGTSIVSSLIKQKLIPKSQYNYVMDHLRVPQGIDCDELVFSFVRNPFDRIVSIFKWLDSGIHKKSPYRKTGSVKFNTTFEDWFTWRYIDKKHKWYDGYTKGDNFIKIYPECLLIECSINQYAQFGWYSQFDFLKDDETLRLKPNFIGRYENIDEDWKELSKIIKCDPTLPHVNKTFKSDYRKYFTSEMRKKVEEIYFNDFSVWNYDW